MVSRGIDRATAAHPRSRGEHITWLGGQPPAGGSSPLARGTRAAVQSYMENIRLIPARAGNTAEQRPWNGAPTAHPRSRGEH